MLNDDYVSPADLNKIGHYSVYIENWIIDDEGVWGASAVPLKFHSCTANDLLKFYKLRGEEELTKKMLLNMNCID